MRRSGALAQPRITMPNAKKQLEEHKAHQNRAVEQWNCILWCNSSIQRLRMSLCLLILSHNASLLYTLKSRGARGGFLQEPLLVT